MRPANLSKIREERDAIASGPLIPEILAHRAERILEHHYGSWWRAVWEVAARRMRGACLAFYWTSIMRFCDFCGWTKCVDGLRHDSKCKDPGQCIETGSFCDCLYGSIPKWFASVTGMRD